MLEVDSQRRKFFYNNDDNTFSSSCSSCKRAYRYLQSSKSSNIFRSILVCSTIGLLFIFAYFNYYYRTSTDLDSQHVLPPKRELPYREGAYVPEAAEPFEYELQETSDGVYYIKVQKTASATIDCLLALTELSTITSKPLFYISLSLSFSRSTLSFSLCMYVDM